MKTEREKVVEIANTFAPFLSDPNLSEMDIDALIEELRPLRMKIRAIDYGSAPGFREYDVDRHQNAGNNPARPKRVTKRLWINYQPIGLTEELVKGRRLKVNQVELQIQEYENQADAIIFLHFGGSNLTMWQGVIPYFKDLYRLILVDLRGHGKSDRPATGYHMDEMAKDVIGIMEHFELEQAHIIGSSIGAEVGLSMAANYPERVISLVLDGALSSEFGPYGTWDGTEQAFEEFVAEQLEKIQNAPDAIYASLNDLVDDRRGLFEKYGWWNEYLEIVVRYDALQMDDGKYARGMGKKANLNYMDYYYHYRFENYYQKVKCPLLMLAEKDLEDAREKAAMLGLKGLAKQAEIVEIKDWAHPYMWFLEPEEAVNAILLFLDKVVQQ